MEALKLIALNKLYLLINIEDDCRFQVGIDLLMKDGHPFIRS